MIFGDDCCVADERREEKRGVLHDIPGYPVVCFFLLSIMFH